MIAFGDALTRVLAGAARLGSERVPLAVATGRVLAEDLVAGADMPAFSYSAMDGYAVRSAELTGPGPFRLPVRGESPAGGTFALSLEPGSACRIFTGAPIPERADAVIIQEDTARDGDAVTFSRAPPAGQNIRARGTDLAAGSLALAAGSRLDAGRVGLCAALDRPEVAVGRRPIVSILSTGDELRAPGQPRNDGRAGVVESNGIVIRALCERAGASATCLPFVGDDRAATLAAVRGALERSDLLVTIGGASVGDHDLVRPSLEAAGASIDFWGVAIKPGKPTGFGRSASARALCLPGNPASATLTWLLFGMPLVRALQGDAEPRPPRALLRVLGDYPRRVGREEYLRAELVLDQGEPCARLDRNQSSGAVTSFARADALVVVAAEHGAVTSGERLPVIRLADV